MKFVRRTSQPSKDNKYYLHTTKGYNKCIRISGDECIPNCTGYCYGRYMESQEIKKCNLPTSNAENWYHDYTGKKGKTPKLGAICVWKKGKIHYSKDGAGHVAFVEHVYSTGKWDSSESAYNGKRWFTRQYDKSCKRTGYQFEGFIYPEIEFDSDKWEAGKYQILKPKYLRSSAKVGVNKISVKSCSKLIREQLDSLTGSARFKEGAEVTLSSFKVDSKGNTWGKVVGNNVTTYICVLDSSGYQVKKV